MTTHVRKNNRRMLTKVVVARRSEVYNRSRTGANNTWLACLNDDLNRLSTDK